MRTYIYMILAVTAAIALVALYLKAFESRQVFFPSRTMGPTPYSIGAEYDDVYFSTEDGISLNGWFVPADRKEARGTILFFHGNAGNITHRLRQIGAFNRKGLDVFIFDYRGYGRSEGSPSEKGIYLDAEAAYRYLVSEKGVRPDEVVLYGRSLGAAPAIYLSAGDRGRVLIADSAFTSAADMARRLYPFLPVRRFLSVRLDNLSRMKRVRMPKLIIHSRDDEIVPFSQGERLYEIAPEPKTMYAAEGGHNEGVLKFEADIMGAIDRFLSANGI